MQLMWLLRWAPWVELLLWLWLWTQSFALMPALALSLLSGLAARALLCAASLLLARPRWSSLTDLLQAWIGETWALTRAYALDMAWRVRRRGRVRSGVDRPLIVLVHGFLCNAGVWASLTRRLDEEGLDWIAVNLPPWYRRMALNRVLLGQGLRGSRRRPLILIGHSMGGVLSADFAARHPRRCLATIALGAPFRGTDMARLVFAGRCGPLTVDANWLRRPRPRPVPAGLLSIYSRHDNLVSPQESAHVEGGRNQIFSGIGHLHLCQSRQVMDAVMGELARIGGRTEGVAEGE